MFQLFYIKGLESENGAGITWSSGLGVALFQYKLFYS